jgi:hypothetical protein
MRRHIPTSVMSRADMGRKPVAERQTLWFSESRRGSALGH